MVSRLVAWLLLSLLPPVAAAQQSVPTPPPDGITQLVLTIEKAADAGDAAALRALVTSDVRSAPLSECVQSLTCPRAARSTAR